ncbi:uncharacterized protein LOC141687010 isoform X2 [Apium graveolens]|uniref:uncharacterized protein LOC141687010 isoform X2 n=1 Tax=Apium graveolens TaxID=4045 RepID=UPI003D7AD2FF
MEIHHDTSESPNSDTSSCDSAESSNIRTCKVCLVVMPTQECEEPFVLCPYQSCKNCCAKAQNPCHIHVLKGSTSFPDKAPATGSPSSEQQPNDVSPLGNSHRATSVRQLSSNFSQFNNLQNPIRSRKPLTRQEAGEINEWRYQKVQEYKDQNIELENEAFDRYMRNVGLLEEVFNVKSTSDGPMKDGGSPTSEMNTTSAEDERQKEIAEIKMILRSEPTRAENFRNRIQCAVDEALKKLQKSEAPDGGAESIEQDEFVTGPEKKKFRRHEEMAALIDKINKARNEEDLKVCIEMKNELFGKQTETTEAEPESAPVPIPLDSDDVVKPQFADPPLKWFTVKHADAEEIERMNKLFDSMEDIEEL